MFTNRKTASIEIVHADERVDTLRVPWALVGQVADALCRNVPAWTTIHVHLQRSGRTLSFRLEARDATNPLWRLQNPSGLEDSDEHTRFSALDDIVMQPVWQYDVHAC